MDSFGRCDQAGYVERWRRQRDFCNIGYLQGNEKWETKTIVCNVAIHHETQNESADEVEEGLKISCSVEMWTCCPISEKWCQTWCKRAELDGRKP